MHIDMVRTPFSRARSYLSITQDGKSQTLFLRQVRHKVGGGPLMEIDFFREEQACDVRIAAEPAVINVSSDDGRARLYLRGTDELVIESQGLDVRLQLHKGGGYVYPVGQRRHTLQKQQCYITITALAGRDAMLLRRYMHADGIQRVDQAGVMVSAGDGRALIHLKTEEIEAPYVAPVADVDRETAAIRDEWQPELAKLPAMAGPYADLAARAWHLLWSATVPADGNLPYDAVYMAKANMCALWSWDHCFNAMALAKGDWQRGLEQWLLPFAVQRPTGQLPDRFTATEATWITTKPPVHGWCLSHLLAGRTIDQDLAGRLYDHLERFTNWWFAFRDTDGDGVPNYVGGCCSGWDNSTAFDPGLCPETPDLSAFLVLQMDTLAELATRLGDLARASHWQRESEALLQRMYDHCWRDGSFVAPISGTHAVAGEGTSLLLCIPVVLGARLDAQKLDALEQRIRRDFLTNYGLATEMPASPLYQPDGYWRGPIWAPSTCLIVDGLLRAGRTELAREIARRFCAMVEQAGGFYENYDALTGKGLRDPGYTWSAAVALWFIAEGLVGDDVGK